MMGCVGVVGGGTSASLVPRVVDPPDLGDTLGRVGPVARLDDGGPRLPDRTLIPSGSPVPNILGDPPPAVLPGEETGFGARQPTFGIRARGVANIPISCNCRVWRDCPLQNRCLTNNIVYEATVCSGLETWRYVGSTGRNFKDRYYNHRRSFVDPGLRNVTSLAQLIHRLKDAGSEFRISWRIIRRAIACRGEGGPVICASRNAILY